MPFLDINNFLFQFTVICAEITQTVIENVSEAIDWLKRTYFYIRVLKNPNFYGFKTGQTPDILESQLKDLCVG
jgi:hypothetical protein